MGKRLLAGVLALCLLLGGCSMDRENSSSSGAEDLIVMEGISPGEETPPSRIWIPLGVYSGKRHGRTAGWVYLYSTAYKLLSVRNKL